MRCASAWVCSVALVAAWVGCGASSRGPEGHGAESRPVLVSAAPPVRPVGGRVEARIATGVMAVCSIVPVGDRLWLSAPEERELLAVDARRNRVVARVHVPGKPCLMRSAGGMLWVDVRRGLLVALDPATGRVLRHVRTESTCGYGFDFAAGSLWIAEAYPVHSVTRRDPRTGATLATAPSIGPAGSNPCAVTAAGGWIWVGTPFGIYRVDPSDVRRVARVDAGPASNWTVVRIGDELWVGNERTDQLHQLDARTGHTRAIYQFGGGEITGGDGRVWTTGSGWADRPAGRVPVLVEIDPHSDRVLARFRVGRRDPGFTNERTPEEQDWPIVVQRVLSGIGLADGSLWLHQNAERRLYRIDPRR